MLTKGKENRTTMSVLFTQA